jgi:hypothetical protein
VSVTPMLLYLLASLPEARTVCGKAACTGLCGGRWVTGVPTAIETNQREITALSHF